MFPARSNAVMLNNTSLDLGQHSKHYDLLQTKISLLQTSHNPKLLAICNEHYWHGSKRKLVIVNENHTDGQVKFNITAFDLAGNSLTVNQTNLNSSNLTIDKNVPGVSNLTLYSNNSNSSLARAGDLINITLEVSEQTSTTQPCKFLIRYNKHD